MANTPVWTAAKPLTIQSDGKNAGCPYCGGAYTRTILCDACGEPIVGDYVKIQTTGDCYCDECFMMKSLGEDDS